MSRTESRGEPALAVRLDAAPPQILIVEDDPRSSSALDFLLSRRGWKVTVAPTRAEALLRLAERPTWIVLDLMLPDGDGEDVLRDVRTRALPIRVCVVTAVSDEQRLAAVQALAPDALLHKPLTFDRLTAVLTSPG